MSMKEVMIWAEEIRCIVEIAEVDTPGMAEIIIWLEILLSSQYLQCLH